MTRTPPPNAPGDPLIDEWVSHLIEAGGFTPDEAEAYRSVVLDFQRQSGIADFRKVKREDLERYLEEEAERQEDFQRFLREMGEADRKIARELRRRDQSEQ